MTLIGVRVLFDYKITLTGVPTTEKIINSAQTCLSRGVRRYPPLAKLFVNVLDPSSPSLGGPVKMRFPAVKTFLSLERRYATDETR